ncbi:AsmA family protein [Cognatishimia sp. SS12]|uniref:AsmA family protein n=1 Tax=Cognatishimia sp. SS12 TaxID=2979465 RepID=UPI0023305908|nr:AsmA family protein [Cognatishimia sp. SS12]MDC0738153.1 AsmA family protein [Cognatishimia sp. SS12]
MRLIRILLTVCVVIVLGLVGLVFALPGEKIAKIAADQVRAQTGRDLQFDGDVSFSFFPNLGVATGPVTLSNADWSSNGPMFTAQAATIGVDLMALVSGAVEVRELTLEAPTILLERNSAGQANWDLLPAAAPEVTSDTAAQGVERRFTLDRLKVTDANLRYIDPAGGGLQAQNLTAELLWGGGEAELTLSMTPAEDEVSVTARISDLDALANGEITALTAQIAAAGNRVELDGRASVAPEFAGSLTADMPNAARFMAALGLPAGETPPLVFGGDVTFTKQQLLSLRNGDVTMLGNRLSAEADIDLTAKPQVTANIQAGALDLSSFMGADSSGAEAAGGPGGWPKDKIDASFLSLFDGTIALAADSLDTGRLKFGVSRLKIDVDNARAVATLQNLAGYEGGVSGQFVMNNRSGLSVGGQLSLAGLALNPLLTDLLDIDRFTGLADAQIAFLGSGASIDAIIKSLRGDGSLSVGQGTISGIDLDKLFRGTPAGGTTVFDSMQASWTISEGSLQNEDLLMDLPRVQAKGRGRIGLGAQDIDYTFAPQIKNASDSGIAVPVRIRGPWAEPKIWPDLDAVVNQNFSEEKKQLQEKAKAKVAEKLGVVPVEGESLEKTLEKKLEEEVGKGLLKLLGGGN